MRDFFFRAEYYFPRNLFACFFFSKWVCGIFYLKSAITPSKVKWWAPKIHQTNRLLTKLLVSWQILICQSFLKPFETIGDKTLKGRGEEFVSTYPYTESPYGRKNGDVITKFSQMDSYRDQTRIKSLLRRLKDIGRYESYSKKCIELAPPPDFQTQNWVITNFSTSGYLLKIFL